MSAFWSYEVAGGCFLASVFLFCATNAKSLPFAHTLRLLPSLYRLRQAQFTSKVDDLQGSKTHLFDSASHRDRSSALFEHHVTRTCVSLMELDINIHKSNSTFFIDADVSRMALLTQRLSQALARSGSASFILAGAQCSFRREIRPFQKYLVSSRILAWDSKWLLTVTYFLNASTGAQDDGGLPAEIDVRCGPAAVLRDQKLGKSVLAVMISKFVVKAGRTTVPPQDILRSAGLLDCGSKADEVVVREDIRESVERGLQYVKECM